MRKNYVTLVYLPQDEENANYLADLDETVTNLMSLHLCKGEFKTYHCVQNPSSISEYCKLQNWLH